ncbi:MULTISPECIES: rhomboid family intramembrane serine protease GlpG [unclassified Pseudoalteromonas]|uniref:rhomboid family intramembrane serine protease GlpG n=1 Tax=unclassified Pseudoalteromonas TaxID=194690 RepID=UPI001891C9D3|nr:MULTISPECIES: rhomboid family intramembrane serine protease GlpG [unclassified Pseudoalteromonas]MCG7561815.1 rhomboid family intramembrane serine protease GlpG [Pseudoalteromonas sp. McH1-42]
MKLLGSHNNPRAVQGVADYLKTHHIECRVTSEDGQQASVWVAEQHWSQASEIWQEFVADPYQDKYLAASWQLAPKESPLVYQGTKLNLWQRFTQLSWMLKAVFILSLGIFMSFFVYGVEPVFDTLQFDPHSPWRWITPAFLHFGLLHLVFNLSWWIYLGNMIERRLGNWVLWTVFVAGALLSNWMQYLLADANFGGLSGVVYALLGFCWIHSVKHPQSPPLIGTPVVGFMLIWMVLGFMDVLFVNMANWAHLFGLLAGMGVATLLRVRDSGQV